MVCKYCGTQYTGAVCTNCGKTEKDQNEALNYQNKAPKKEDTPPAVNDFLQETPLPAEKPKKEKPKKEKSEKPKREKKERAERQAPESPVSEEKKPESPEAVEEKGDKKAKKKGVITLRRVFLPALLLLCPLAYFFIDLFAVYSGSAHPNRLFEFLSAAGFSENSYEEIVEAVLGENVPFFRYTTLLSIFKGTAPEGLSSAMIAAVFPLLSAVMGVLLLITAGRLLRSRLLTDLVVLGGTGAVFTPLIASLALRLSSYSKIGAEATDTVMSRIALSMESLLLCCFLVLALLPAVARLKKLSAYAHEEERHIVLPYRVATKLPFFLNKILALVFLLASFALAGLFLIRPIMVDAALIDYASDWTDVLSDLPDLAAKLFRILTRAETSPNFVRLSSDLADTATLLAVLFLALSLLTVLLALVRLLFASRRRLCEKPRARRRLAGIGRPIRRLCLAPFVALVGTQILLVLLWLFASPIALRIDFANVDTTLSLIYLTVCKAKDVIMPTTTCVLLTLVGALIWHTAGKLAAAMATQGHKYKK